MATVRDLVHGALRSIGRVGRGKPMSAAAAADGLEILNQMLSFWSTESLMVPARVTEVFTYPSVKNTYTIGVGGDLDTVAPTQIITAFHRDNGTDFPMKSMSLNRFNAIRVKAVGTYPTRYYFSPDLPLATISFDYRPATQYELHLTSLKAITAFSSLNDIVVLPEGFEFAIRTNLALAIASDYGMSASQQTQIEAMQSKKSIKRIAKANREDTLIMDSGLSQNNNFNIYDGGFR